MRERDGLSIAKTHILLASALEVKNKLIQQHSAEMKRQGNLEQKRFMMECFKQDIKALPVEAREFITLQRESFLEDLCAEVAAKKARRMASEESSRKNEDRES